jgi:hypothetical protein
MILIAVESRIRFKHALTAANVAGLSGLIDMVLAAPTHKERR